MNSIPSKLLTVTALSTIIAACGGDNSNLGLDQMSAGQQPTAEQSNNGNQLHGGRLARDFARETRSFTHAFEPVAPSPRC